MIDKNKILHHPRLLRPCGEAVMTDITIPPEAVEAALPFTASCAYYCKPSANDCQCRQNTYRALRAGIEAWPGVIHDDMPHIILPLPQEVSDE